MVHVARVLKRYPLDFGDGPEPRLHAEIRHLIVPPV